MIRISPTAIRADITRYSDTYSVGFMIAGMELAEDAIYANGQEGHEAGGTRAQFRLLARGLVRDALAAGAGVRPSDREVAMDLLGV